MKFRAVAAALFIGAAFSFLLSGHYRHAKEIERQEQLTGLAFDSAGSLAERGDALAAEVAALRARVNANAAEAEFGREGLASRERELRAALEVLGEDIRALRAAVAAVTGRIEGAPAVVAALEDRLRALEERAIAETPPAPSGVVPVSVEIEETRTVRVGGAVASIEKRKGLREGTGFVVRPGVLLTAGHMFEVYPDGSVENAIVEGENGAILIGEVTWSYALGASWFECAGQRVPLAVVRSSVEPLDAARCSFEASAYSGTCLEVAEEEPVFGATAWVLTWRPEVRKGPVAVRGVAAGRHDPEDQNSDQMFAVYGQPGMSGSPILHRGRVVGILVHGYGPGASVTANWIGATPLRALQALLAD